MGIKSTEVDHKAENNIIDDLSDVTVEPKQDAVDSGKLNALKERLAQMQKQAAPVVEAVKEVVKEEKKMVEKKKRSINLGVVGSGQAGSRIAEVFYGLGYDAIAINTAQQDLEQIDIPEVNKLFMDYSLGGASKDQAIGHEAAQMYKDKIYDLVKEKLDDAQVFLLAFSLGGGSGGGSVETLVNVLSIFEKPIVVITVLPMTNEDAQTKSNALEALSRLSKMVQEKTIHNLIVVDNAKLEVIFNSVSQLDFYDVGNKQIAEIIDVFNTYSTKSSKVKSLDSMELLKILIDGEGLSLLGCMDVYNFEEETAIAESIITNLSSGLLASGFNLKQTKYVGVLVLATPGIWARIPSASINFAMSMIQDVAGTPLGVFRGLYESNQKEKDGVVKVYSFFSGLALPDARIEELKREVAVQKNVIKDKSATRNFNLNIDTGASDTVNAVEQIKKKIATNNSAFGKLAKNLVIDKRKK